MIQTWSKFNESNETITKEIVQEIMYYCASMDSTQYHIDEIDDKIQNSIESVDENFWGDFYEVSYSELNQIIDKWFNKCKSNPELTTQFLEIYSSLRKKLSNFPEMYQIEDELLDLIEIYKFNFQVNIHNDKLHPNRYYDVRLYNWQGGIDMDNYIKILTSMNGISKSISTISPKCEVKFYGCQYNPDSWCEFKIQIIEK
jgi:hypothetical protein